MLNRSHLQPLAALLVLPFFVACADAEEEPYTEEELPPPAMEEAPPEAADALQPEVITLASLMDDPAVTGEATILREGGVVMVALEVQGLPAAGEYQAHIHSGSCAEPGGVEVPLDPVMGLDDGTGSSMTTVEEGEMPDADWFIFVHGEDGTPVACGEPTGEA